MIVLAQTQQKDDVRRGSVTSEAGCLTARQTVTLQTTVHVW